ncbi:MAG TPA: SH3 domain-containing protein [Chthoniobacterales bacterium]
MNGLSRWIAGLMGLGIAFLPLRAADEFYEANEQYGAANYEQAARTYRLALDKGELSAEIYYNLALAESKAGKSAEASLNFQRALTLNPALEPARRELLALASRTGMEIPPATWVDRLAALAPAASWWTGGAVAAWAGAFILLGGLFARRRRGTLILLGAVVFLAGKGTLFLAWSSDPLIQNRPLAVITAEGTDHLRSAPVENSATVTRLPGGSTVALLAERGKWAYCAALDGKKGWIERDNLQPVMPRES